MNQPPAGMELEEQFFVTGRAQLHRWLPWLHMSKAFRLAIDSRRMLVAFMAVCLWGAGEQRLEAIWKVTMLGAPAKSLVPSTQNSTDSEIIFPGTTSALEQRWSSLDLRETSHFIGDSEYGIDDSTLEYFLGGPFAYYPLIRWPALKFKSAFYRSVFPSDSFPDRLHSLVELSWIVLVGGIFGGILCRMSAVDFSGEGGSGLWSAIRFSGKHWLALIGAPILACIGLGIFWLLNAFLGLAARIPWVGDSAVGLVWFLPLFFGLLMALITVGLVVGWPLMVAAIGTEATDSFDAISRTYSYVFNRPWYLGFLSCVMAILGGLLLCVFCWILHLAMHLTAESVSFGLGESGMQQLFQNSPDIVVPERFSGNSAGSGMPPVAPALVGVWMNALAMLPNAFAFSFFWCSITIIYFLLRLSEDGTPLTEVDLTDVKPRDRAKLPLAGMAAAAFREKSFSVVRGGGGAAPPESSAGPQPE